MHDLATRKTVRGVRRPLSTATTVIRKAGRAGCLFIWASQSGGTDATPCLSASAFAGAWRFRAVIVHSPLKTGDWMAVHASGEVDSQRS